MSVICCFQVFVLQILFFNYVKVVDEFSQLKVCNRTSFFVPESLDLCNRLANENLAHSLKYYMLSSFLINYQNQGNYVRLLILLSGDISLNPGPLNLSTGNQDWRVFEKRGLHMAHININSLLPKVDELRAIAASTKLSIIGVTETKLDDTIKNSEVDIEGYTILRKDRNRRGGGVACYVRSDLCHNTHDKISEDLECVVLDILLPNTKQFIVGIFYRPPDENNFLEKFAKLLTPLDLNDKELYLLGDFNINTFCNNENLFKLNKNALRKEQYTTLQKQYIELCSLFSLKQIIEEPTRTTSTSSTLIDHILTNYKQKVSQSGVICTGLSDHEMIFCTRKITKHKSNAHKQFKFRSFKNYSDEQYRSLLGDANFPNYGNFTDVDLAYKDFTERLMSVIDQVAPIKEARIKCNSQDWFDGEIAEKISERDRLFKKFKKTKLQIDLDLWKEAKKV